MLSADIDTALRAYIEDRLAVAIARTLATYVNVKYPQYSVGVLPHYAATNITHICVPR